MSCPVGPGQLQHPPQQVALHLLALDRLGVSAESVDRGVHHRNIISGVKLPAHRGRIRGNRAGPVEWVVANVGRMTTYDRPFGRYYEDFEPGDVYKHWPGKTITEADDHLFCMITMNHHPLHTDAWYAETQTQFGKNVVVGNLVYSLVLGMSVADVSGAAIANLEVESLQHKMPTFHGDTIYAETIVLEKRESSSRPDRGVVTVESRGFNQRGEEVCYFRRKVMVPKREAAKPRERPYASPDDRPTDAPWPRLLLLPDRRRGDAGRPRARHDRRSSRSSTTARSSRATRSWCPGSTSRRCATSTGRCAMTSSTGSSRSRPRSRTASAADGSFVATNNVVSQSVPHLHVHVVPRPARTASGASSGPGSVTPTPTRRPSSPPAFACCSRGNDVIL